MFKNRPNTPQTHLETTLIASGARIEGTIRFKGTLEIEGEVVGDILAEGDGRAMIRILESGRVIGEVRAPMIVVNGAVTGNIHSTDHVELAANAAVNGDVHYNLIEMVKGSKVEGQFLHVQDGARSAESKPAKPEDESKVAGVAAVK